MNRRRSNLVLRSVLAAAVIAGTSGCGATKESSNVVARVDDATLTFDDLEVSPDPARPGVAEGDAVRAEVSGWVRSQLAASGGVDKLYPTAVGELGVMCVDVMPARQQDQASLDELIDGIDADGWEAIATTYDEAGTPTSPPCQPTENVPPIFLDPLTAAKPGEIIRIADPTAGYGVLRVRPFDQVDPGEFLAALAKVDPAAAEKAAEATLDAVIYVNPRVGTYSPASMAVEPLGPPAAAAPAG